jgi:hypothetical protein
MKTATGKRITITGGHPVVSGRFAHLAKLFLLGVLPLAGTTVGAFVDESRHLGLSNWRSACRAAGFSLRPVWTFTLELLPTAVAGFLAGGLALLVLGIVLRRHGDDARRCFAAHAGCAITMPIGMALCALALPLQSMLLADVVLALAGAWAVYWMVSRRGTAAVGPHT